MPTYYEVEEGDGIEKIAYENGLAWETVWHHPENTQLRDLRKRPNILMPGDIVYVPDRERGQVSRPTDQTHKFVRKGVPASMNLRLMRNGKPRRNLPYVLNVDGQSIPGKTDADGWIRVTLPPNAEQATLLLNGGQEQRTVRIGAVDPIDTIQGAQRRLLNLGLYDGAVDGVLEGKTVAALRTFQRSRSLAVTGKLDPATQAALQRAHAS